MSTYGRIEVSGRFHGIGQFTDRMAEIMGFLGWSVSDDNTEVIIKVGARQREIRMPAGLAAGVLRYITHELDVERNYEAFRNDVRPPQWLPKHRAAIADVLGDRFCAVCHGTEIGPDGFACTACDHGITHGDDRG